MANVSGQMTVSSSFSQNLTSVPAGANAQPPAVSVPISAGINLANGTAADQGDLKYTKTLTFAASTPQTLNLQALTDVEGNVVNFARIRSIIIKMRGLADAVTLKLGTTGVVANTWTSLISNPGQLILQAFPTTKNDAFFCLSAPGATGYVVGSSNRLLTMDPGTAAFTIDIEINGCSV